MVKSLRLLPEEETVRVKVKVTEQVVPGLVFMSFHFSDVPTNVLTLNEFDPISGTAEFKACAVKVTKLAAPVQ